MLTNKTFARLILLTTLTIGSFTNADGDTVSRSAYQPQRRIFLSHDFQAKDNKVKVAFIDADSTVRVSRSGSVSANTARDVAILPNVATRLAALNQQGFLLIIVSNQGGVGSGIITEEVADRALRFTISQINKRNSKAKIHYYDYAEAKNEFRKPGIGMARELERKLSQQQLSVDYSNSIMIGDSAFKRGLDTRPDGTPGTHFSNSDRLFAKNLGIQFIEAAEFFGWRENGIDVFDKLTQVKAYCSVHQCLR